MLYNRQKLLLRLVNVLGGQVGNLDFQKLLLFYCLEYEDEPTYEFVPYRYGGFSFTSYADKRKLIEKGLLEDEDQVWKLTPAGMSISTEVPLHKKMHEFAEKYEGLRGNELVAESYRRYPYYAIHSEIADRVLAGDKKSLKAVDEARPSRNRPALCTIGYEGRSLEGFLNVLIQNGMTVLYDVRRNALSRKYGFSKSTLSKGCEGVGIRYEHLPELGIVSEHRKNLKTPEDYKKLFDTYMRKWLPHQGETLVKIAESIKMGERVALTCYEHLPEYCHRSCIANAVQEMIDTDIPTIHF
jgi:uncharacterized protein (DUF488 family)